MDSSLKVMLGEWLPDLPYYENPGLVEANNAIPVDKFYKDFLPLSTGDDALGARVSGAFAALDTTGNPAIYAGNNTALSIKSGTTWTEVSGATYNTAADGFWDFAQFDDLVIASNYADAIQAATVGGSTFGSLATAGSATSPKARHVAVIGNFVVAGDTDETANGAVQHRLQWSAINQPRNWPLPGSSTATATQAGEQFLEADRGAITGIFSGDQYGLVSQKTAVTRVTYVGAPVVFQFDIIDRERGVWFPNSAIQLGARVYFASFDGFYMSDGVSVIPIGNGKVDKTFLANVDQNFIERVRAAIDYQTKNIIWAYPDSMATNGNPNRLLFYNWSENRWSQADDELEIVFPSYSEALTLDALDAIYTSLDDIGISLDASILQGGIKSAMGFGTDHKLGTFSGSPPVATFETGEFEGSEGGYFFVSGVVPMVTGQPSGITVALSTRLTQDNTSRSFGAAVSPTARTGQCDFRENLRYGSLRLEVTGGFDRALGVKLIGQDAGQP